MLLVCLHFFLRTLNEMIEMMYAHHKGLVCEVGHEKLTQACIGILQSNH